MKAAADINDGPLRQPFLQFIRRLTQAILHINLLGLIPRKRQVQSRQITIDQPLFQLGAAEEVVFAVTLAE